MEIRPDQIATYYREHFQVQPPRIAPPEVPGNLLCQCARYCWKGNACKSPMTQEDLLCDMCRERRRVDHCHVHDHLTSDCEMREVRSTP